MTTSLSGPAAHQALAAGGRAPAPTTVEILIVSFNTAAMLAACLDSVAAHLPAPHEVSVAVSVLDNASGDGSAELVRTRFPWVRLVESPVNVGFAKANNRLAAEARADYLLLLNSDTCFTEDIITALLAALRSDPDVVVAGPRLVYPDGRPQFSSELLPTLRYELARELKGTRLAAPFDRQIRATIDHYRRRRDIEDRVSHRAEFLWATCWLLRRDQVLRHGLFTEGFDTYDEDLDFCRRLRDRSGTLAYVAGTELVHVGGASSSSEAKQQMLHAARQRYYRRYGGPARAGAYRLLYRCTGGLRSLRRRQAASALPRVGGRRTKSDSG